MKTRHVIYAALSSVAIFVSACTTAHGSPVQTTVSAGYDEFAQSKNVARKISVKAGSELVVSVPSNPSTGYGWTDATSETPGILAQTGSKYVAPGGGAAGATGTQVWTFKAFSKGTTTLRSDYSRPWEGGEKGEWTFQVTVTVE
jgi:inhibitor of cysteine peptidase